MFAADASNADTLVWTGGGVQPVFSDAANWSSSGSNTTPHDGDTISFNGTGTVYNDIGVLRPASITFGSAAEMAIAGDYGFEGLSQIVNDSSSDQTISVPVRFGTSGAETAIDVSNNGAGIVKFPGTVTGLTIATTTPVFDGHYVLTSTSAWAPTANTVVKSGSSLTLPAYTGNGYMTIEAGGTVHVTGNATSTTQLAKANYGALRIDGTASVKGNLSTDTGSTGAYYFGTLQQSGGDLTINNYAPGAFLLDTAGIVFGSGGLPIVNQRISIASGMHPVFRFVSDCTLAARASSGNTSGYGRINGAVSAANHTLYIDTTDFDDKTTPRNVTVYAAFTKCSFVIMGKGRVAYGCPFEACDYAIGGTLVVSNTATMALLNNSQFVSGMATMLPGTTLELANSKTVANARSLKGGLTLCPGSTVSNATGLAATVTPLAVASLAFGEGDGTVVFDTGSAALGAGTYTLLSSTAAMPADTISRISIQANTAAGKTVCPYVSSDGKRLCIAVVQDVPYAWTGAGGDNKMSTAANWAGGAVPAEGSPLDFSAAPAGAAIAADTGTAYGAVTMGANVITFTGSLTASSFSDTSKIAVGANALVTIDGDVTAYAAATRLCNTIAAGGKLWIKGKFTLSGGSSDYHFEDGSGTGALVVEGGIVFNTGRWVVVKYGSLVLGEAGISFAQNTAFCFWYSPTVYPLGERMVIGGGGALKFQSSYTASFCTTRFESAEPATIVFNGDVRGTASYWAGFNVTGCGRMEVSSTARTDRGFTVKDTATVSVAAGFNTANANDQTLEIQSGATLEVPGTGTFASGFQSVKFGDGATMSFDIEENANSVYQFRSGTLSLPASGKVNIRVFTTEEGNVRSLEPHVLTTYGGFAADAVTSGKVELASDCPSWADRIEIVGNNIVFYTKQPGLTLSIR